MPLENRMARFAELRELGAFLPASFDNPMSGLTESFSVTTLHAELVDISRRPEEFCSGRGAVSIPDLPAEALEFFGSFINMDDPRHARQRGIVSRSFTPRQLASVLESVETICSEVIDAMCEQGEVDLVEALSQPFPAPGHLRHDGHPAQRVPDGARRDQRHPRCRRPRDARRPRPDDGNVRRGDQLSTLMNELAEERRKEPRQRPHVRAGRTRRTTRTSWRRTRSRRSSSCSRSRETTPPARRSVGACTCCRSTPISAGSGRTISTRVTTDRGGGDRARRVTGHFHAPHRDEGAHGVGDHEFDRRRQGRAALRRRQP